uniref:Uncharacterized protein n=1 Tax=Oryza sativa subsp. japonica TaxID=39947 RepID=Q6K9A5_ORYSJ|nr:hypothetical protein [Oryza sativa Japonica Group]BAD19245.1 hypothetical protein [Oryza sativa Japonica Group]
MDSHLPGNFTTEWSTRLLLLLSPYRRVPLWPRRPPPPPPTSPALVSSPASTGFILGYPPFLERVSLGSLSGSYSDGDLPDLLRPQFLLANLVSEAADARPPGASQDPAGSPLYRFFKFSSSPGFTAQGG